LHGTFGTGKTLAAHKTATIATDEGWTFVYATEAGDIAAAYRFAQTYSPAVLFVEDCDRELNGERTDATDAILNTVDGIESKGAEVLLIMTTNNADRIPSAMRRPGRIDACIEVTPPDAEAVGRLIAYYGRGRLTGDTAEAQQRLAGQIPAVIRETVERAKLYAIAAGRQEVTAQDVNGAAESMEAQVAFMARDQDRDPHPGEVLAGALRDSVLDDVAMESIASRVADRM
jgi:transitional endoplasmic reticulum ATPase